MDLPPVSSTMPLASGFDPGAKSGSDRRADLEEAARGFEALFLNQMMKTARAASLGDGLFSSSGLETTQSLFDQAVTDAGSNRSGLGLAQAIYRQFAPLANAPKAE